MAACFVLLLNPELSPLCFLCFLFKEASPTVFQMRVFSGDLKCPLLLTDTDVTIAHE